MTISINGLDSRFTVIKDFSYTSDKSKRKADPVGDYRSVNGMGVYAAKTLPDLSEEIAALTQLYDRPVRDIVENHSNVLQSRMEFRRKKPQEPINYPLKIQELLLKAHTEMCAKILERYYPTKTVEVEKPKQSFTILKEEKKVNQYPPGTLFENGVPYFPAYDQFNAPITNQYGAQLYADPSGNLFEAPQQQQQHVQQTVQTYNRSYAVNNHNPNMHQNRHVAPQTVYQERQPAQQTTVIDNWSSHSTAVTPNTRHTPPTTRISVENNRPKMNAMVTQQVTQQAEYEVEEDWKTTAQQPYPLAYNPLAQQLIKIKTQAGVMHDLKPLSPVLDISKMSSSDWSYLEHELDPQQRIRYKDEMASAALRAKRINAPAEFLFAPASLADLKADDRVNTKEPLTANSITLDDIEANDVDSAINVIYSTLIENDVSINNIAGAVCSLNSVIPLTEAEREFDIERLKRAKTLAKLSMELRVMYGLDGIASPFWLAADKFLTNMVNSFLKYQMGLPVTITSFAEDGHELMGYLLTAKGEKVHAIAASHEPSMLEVFQNWIHNVKDAESGEIDHGSIALIKRQLIIVTNVTQLEFNLAVDNKLGYGILNPQQHGNLMAALQPMFSHEYITDSVMIVFAGGTRGYFHRSAIIDGCVVFSLER